MTIRAFSYEEQRSDNLKQSLNHSKNTEDKPNSKQNAYGRKTAEINDATLVKLTLEGNSNSFEILCRRHTFAIANTVARIVGRQSEAEDIVQETFLKAFLELKQLRDPSLFLPWIRKIAISKTHQYFRKAKIFSQLRIKKIEEEDLELTKLITHEASAEMVYELKLVQQQIRSFPTKVRITWVLHEVEEHTLEEISTLTGYSLASTKRYLAKARIMLKEVLREQ